MPNFDQYVSTLFVSVSLFYHRCIYNKQNSKSKSVVFLSSKYFTTWYLIKVYALKTHSIVDNVLAHSIHYKKMLINIIKIANYGFDIGIFTECLDKF